jgi:hypothetical protein
MTNFTKGDIIKFSHFDERFKAVKDFTLDEAVRGFNGDTPHIEESMTAGLWQKFNDRFIQWLLENNYITSKPLTKKEIEVSINFSKGQSDKGCYVEARCNSAETTVVKLELYNYEDGDYTDSTDWRVTS